MIYLLSTAVAVLLVLIWRTQSLVVEANAHLELLVRAAYGPQHLFVETELPDLSRSESEQVGWLMGEAGVLASDWDRVWAKEYHHARCRKLVSLGFHKLDERHRADAVVKYNRGLRDSEAERA